MKIIALGDIHGRTAWKQIVANMDFDRVVFVGDYFDSRDNHTGAEQVQNFKEIIAYKKANMQKVVLLFGNHDFHYLNMVNETYSGFQVVHHKIIQNCCTKPWIRICCKCVLYTKILCSRMQVLQKPG
ncbi:MAG TPA: metallophosphoesterase [Phnomibacter sp.]|nr:metallophosphoesterase [Phnomibacter sp.]